MSSLFLTMQTAAGTLKTMNRALGVTASNLNNSTTSGYARQDVVFLSELGAPSVVTRSSRDQTAERSVQWQNSAQSRYDTLASSLKTVTPLLDGTSQGGVSGAFEQLKKSLSNFHANPTGEGNKYNILIASNALSLAFRETYDYIRSTATNAQEQLNNSVAQVNSLVTRLKTISESHGPNGFTSNEAETSFFGAMQELSSLVDANAVWQDDGSLRLTLGGGAPLIVGGQQYSLALSGATDGATDSGALPELKLTMDGKDVSSQISGGSIAGLLSFHNVSLTGLIGGAGQTGSLNRAAQGIADKVNALMGTGAKPLFTYKNSGGNTAAATLTLNPDLKETDILESSAPNFADFGVSTSSGATVDGMSLTSFLNSVATNLGTDYSNAQSNSDYHSGLYQQAVSVRDGLSGVTVEQEAVDMLQLQRSFEAAAKIISVVDEMTQSILALSA